MCKGEGVLTLLCILLGYTNSSHQTIMRMHAVVLGDLPRSFGGRGLCVDGRHSFVVFSFFFLPILLENKEKEKNWVSAKSVSHYRGQLSSEDQQGKPLGGLS